jgi:xanthine dehydrogenase YagS FAD-binding subunit
MKSFTHINARTVEEACALLRQYDGKAVLNAGGTDLLSTLKGENCRNHPEAIINVKTIAGLDFIEEDGDVLRLGACAKLSHIANSPLVREGYRALAEAARTVATPQIRNMATIGGNLCQDVRCWYYRYPRHLGGPIDCTRKGSGVCPAVPGDNRYHAIFLDKKCFAVCPSDTAVALAALDARIIIAGPTGDRSVAATDFYGTLATTLQRDEMVRSIEIPKPSPRAEQRFTKFSLRKPIDFAVVSIATVITTEDGICTDARIALGAVASGPVRASKAEQLLIGGRIDEEAATKSAELALKGARPLSKNAYKIEIAKTLVKRAILEGP